MNQQSDSESGAIRRRRKQRSSYRQRLSPFWVDSLALLLLIFAFSALLLFFRGELLAAWRLELSVIGLVAGALGVALGLVRLRHHIREHQRWWAGSGCPRCDNDYLKRAPRRWYDRLLGTLGIPLRRYICSQCHWRGPRIDEQRIYR